MDQTTEIDIDSESCNGFYYTNDRQIGKMDDALILSKITERYPDFSPSSSENLLKQVFMIVARDTKFITEMTSKYDLTPHELFAMIYRNYSFLFSGSYVSKIRKLVSRRAYARVSKNERG